MFFVSGFTLDLPIDRFGHFSVGRLFGFFGRFFLAIFLFFFIVLTERITSTTESNMRKSSLLNIFKLELVMLILPVLQRSFVVSCLLLGIVQGLL